MSFQALRVFVKRREGTHKPELYLWDIATFGGAFSHLRLISVLCGADYEQQLKISFMVIPMCIASLPHIAALLPIVYKTNTARLAVRKLCRALLESPT